MVGLQYASINVVSSALHEDTSSYNVGKETFHLHLWLASWCSLSSQIQLHPRPVDPGHSAIYLFDLVNLQHAWGDPDPVPGIAEHTARSFHLATGRASSSVKVEVRMSSAEEEQADYGRRPELARELWAVGETLP